jgi:hypothetical protein
MESSALPVPDWSLDGIYKRHPHPLLSPSQRKTETDKPSPKAQTQKPKQSLKMHFTLTTTILTTLLTLTASQPLVARDASTVLSDLAKINTDLGTLSSAVSSYTGGLTAALDIQTKEGVVEKDLDQATTDTNAAAAFTAGESTSVTNALLGLKPDITGAIDALVAKVCLILLLCLTLVRLQWMGR